MSSSMGRPSAKIFTRINPLPYPKARFREEIRQDRPRCQRQIDQLNRRKTLEISLLRRRHRLDLAAQEGNGSQSY